MEGGRIAGVVRRLMRILRTPNCQRYLTYKDCKRPVLENATRWGTFLSMCRSLLELRPHVITMQTRGKYNLPSVSERQWTQIEDLCELLALPHEITVKYQGYIVLRIGLLSIVFKYLYLYTGCPRAS